MKIKILVLVLLGLVLSGCHVAQSWVEGHHSRTAENRFYEGEHALANHEFGHAAEAFEKLDIEYPFSEYAAKAHLQIIYAYYKSHNEASAVAAAERFIRLYPRHPHIDYAYYMRGVANYSLHQTLIRRVFRVDPSTTDLTLVKGAFNSFKSLVSRFPDSVYVPDARKRMFALRDLLAHQELHTAEYYFRRQAYVASANRASHIVDFYQQSPDVKAALVLMIKSYHYLDLKEKEAEAHDVLAKNFPETTIEFDS